MDKFGLNEKTIILITDLLKKYEQIHTVIIFGSRAKGNFKNGSDIDLAVIGDDIDFKFIQHLSSQLDELSTPYMFDVVDYETIDNDKLRKNVDDNGQIFYRK